LDLDLLPEQILSAAWINFTN